MLNEFIKYINQFMSYEELVLALIGLISIIVIWILGRKIRETATRKMNN